MKKADMYRQVEAEYLAGELQFEEYRRDVARISQLVAAQGEDEELEIYLVPRRAHFRSLRKR